MEDKQKFLWFGHLPDRLDPAINKVFSFSLPSYYENFLTNEEQAELLGSAAQLSEEEMTAAEKAVILAYDEIVLPYLSTVIKEHGCKDFSQTSLSILGGGSILFLLQTCWIYHNMLAKHIKDLEGSSVVAVIPESPPFFDRPRTSLELNELLLNSDFHSWLASRFLLTQKPNGWTFSCYAPERINLSRRSPSLKSRILKLIIRVISFDRCNTDQLQLIWCAFFGLLFSLRKTNFVSKTIEYQAGDNSTPSLPLSFDAALKDILKVCMPSFFLKDFAHCMEKINRKSNFRLGYSRIISSNIYDDFDNLKKALAFEAGEVQFSIQHGGGYGIHKIFPLAPQGEYLGGPFITWGWMRHGEYAIKALPLPSSKLSRLFKKRKNSTLSSDIFFVGADMNPNVLRVHSKPNGMQWLDYRQEKVEFIDALSRMTRRRVIYRGYPNSSVRDAEFLSEKFFDLRVLSGSAKEFDKKLLSASLCIIDHPITTIHISLAMNIPTIMFWNPKHWTFCDEANSYFEELAQVGILHSSGREAAAFLEANLDRLDIWWGDKSVQSARLRWCRQYAHVSSNWVRDWLNALWGPRPSFVK